MEIGTQAPDFKLPGVDGKTHTLKDFSQPLLVLFFSCNHCPYVQAYEERLIAVQKDYDSRGVRLVAINSNDDENYPEDSFEQMARRAQEKGFNFPYLRDAAQETARAYGATHTPHLFVFDSKRRLRYTGKIDDDWQHPDQVKRHYLREALEDLLGGKNPREPVTHAIGCTIKWRRA